MITEWTKFKKSLFQIHQMFMLPGKAIWNYVMQLLLMLN